MAFGFQKLLGHGHPSIQLQNVNPYQQKVSKSRKEAQCWRDFRMFRGAHNTSDNTWIDLDNSMYIILWNIQSTSHTVIVPS